MRLRSWRSLGAPCHKASANKTKHWMYGPHMRWEGKAPFDICIAACTFMPDTQRTSVKFVV